MKERLSDYPAELSEKLAEHHISCLNDIENLERAVARAEVLLYHSALDGLIDHFLQALFAVNKCFFPSRKRTIQYIDGFAFKPVDCTERLLRVIELGGRPDTLAQSYDAWSILCRDLTDIVKQSV